jgi:mannonate dehydratase
MSNWLKLGMMLRPVPEPAWKLAVQAGVEYAVSGISRVAGSAEGPFDAIRRTQEQFAEAGLELAALEGDPFPMDRIKLGQPGRDEDIDRYCAVLEAMGQLGVPIMCYNFMAVIGWLRTRTAVPTRGGALATSFDVDDLAGQPLTPAGTVEEGRLWDNLFYFLERVLPVAEAAGVKMALHPDDPPLSPIRGIGRIITSPQAYDRVFESFPGPCNGLTLCQGNFSLMPGDLCETIRHFGRQGRIFFVHFRDVRGTAERFVETFHDDGPTDLLAAMRAYREVGFNGLVRPDHGPTMEGESNERPGYAMIGRIFAVGYIKGLMAAVAGA